MKKRLIFCSVTGLMVLLGTVIVVQWYSGREFDAVTWAAADTPHLVRQQMADRLVVRRALWGMTRQEVLAMLGHGKLNCGPERCEIRFSLGPERGYLLMDTEYLVVVLDNNDRVCDAHISR